MPSLTGGIIIVSSRVLVPVDIATLRPNVIIPVTGSITYVGTVVEGRITASVSGGILNQVASIQSGRITPEGGDIGSIDILTQVSTIAEGKLTASISGGILTQVSTIAEGKITASIISPVVSAIRFGRNIPLGWVNGVEITAPPANGTLVSKLVSAGKTGYIYGFFISAGEGNDFKINWVSAGTAYSRRIVFGGKGSLQYVDIVPLNEGLGADGNTVISVTTVNAGGAGIVYQSAILVGEV